MRKPFFWTKRDCWYVKVDDKNVRLDPDENKAFKLWEKLRELADFESPNATIESICEAFLTDVKPTTKTPERFSKITLFCEQFCRHVGPSTRARTLAASHVLGWLHSKKQKGDRVYEWSVARKRDAGQCIKRVFRWAINKGLFPRSDILGLRLEQPEPRDSLISYATHKKLVEATKKQDRSKPFGLVLIALWNSGARPIQIRELTACHVTDDGDWEFSKHKTKGKTARKLVVRPAPCLVTLIKILTAARPSGNLFLTSQGLPWTKDGIVRRLARMKRELKIDEPFTAYSYRHTFATDSLIAGVELVNVAALLGHSDASMVSRVYGHVGKHGQPLRNAAADSVGKRNRYTG